MTLKKESQEFIEKEDNVQHEKCDFMTGKKSFSCSHTEKAQKTANRSYFTCQQCGKRFTKKGTLEDHMRVHTEVKPYTLPTVWKELH